MSSHGLVESNRLEEIKQAGISMGPEYAFWREAGWVNDIMVRRNTIRRTGFDPVMHFPQTYAPGAISVIYRGEKPELPRPAMRNEAIRIEENTIEESGGPAIHINQAHGIDITGNTIRRANQVAGEGVGAHYGLTTGKPVCVDASTDVTIDSPEETP